MEQEPFDLSQLFPNIAAQMRGAMANLRLAAAQLAPAAARETDPDLDARAALLDQSYYRLLRLVNDLTAAGCLGQEEPPLPLRDRDLTETARSLCDSAPRPCGAAGSAAGVPQRPAAADLRLPPALHRAAALPVTLQRLPGHPARRHGDVEIRPAGHQVLLSVSDTGCGIQEEQLPHLFDRFLRREDARDPQPHGLGLGLPICQHIAERHGGTMMAESPTRSGLPVHPLPPGPALRKHGRVGCAL